MKRILDTWSIKIIQEAIQIKKKLEKLGYSWADLEKGLSKKVEEIQFMPSKPRQSRPVKICPRCNKSLNFTIIAEQSDKYAEGYRIYWLCGASCCSGKGCGYEEFSKSTIAEF